MTGPTPQLHISLVGTRGVPAHYGGFETAVEEVGRRLVDRGHDVTVYCRGAEDDSQQRYLGMRLVHLPAVRSKALETLSHTMLSVLHLLTQRPRPDVAIVFNAANAPFLPLLRLGRVPAAVHVDGLEWRRAKWGANGRRYYRCVESLSVRWADALIADAAGIAHYYRDEFGASTEQIAYGAPVLDQPGEDGLRPLGLAPNRYHLVVARFEPENHVQEIVRGYHRSAARLPLVVVGSAPYANEYSEQVAAAAADDPRIRLLGGIWDQVQLDQLYAHARTYVHGHSVGGTNPSLLRAMGASTSVIAWDVEFNREVLGREGVFFLSEEELAAHLLDSETAGEPSTHERGRSLRRRVESLYRWDDVAAAYEDLVTRLQAGATRRREVTGRRQPASHH